MGDDRERWGPKGREMWVSTRGTRPAGDVGSPREVRTVDERLNPTVAGEYVAHSLDEVWDLLDAPDWLPPPVPGREYYLLFMDALAAGGLPEHPRLRLLGYDLSDEHPTCSTLRDPCVWVGELEAVAARRGEYGLLAYEDAKLAQSLFRAAWPGIAHFTVWALFEIVPGVEGG